MIRINLLPVRESKKQARLRVQAVLVGVAAAVGVLVSVGIHVVRSAQAAEMRAQIATAQQELESLAATRKEVERYRAEEEEIGRKLRVIDLLEQRRFATVRVMGEISDRVPERMWLTKLVLDEGVLNLAGISIDAEVVAEFLKRLESSEDFSGVELEETALADYQGLKLNRFQVRMKFSGGGALPAAVSTASATPAKPAKR